MSIFESAPFSPTLNAPLYQQLYMHMRTAILSGDLKGGTKLPSSRSLAGELNISRNTVLNAYGQLLAEGYLEGVPGSGTFVARVLPDALLTPSTHRPRRNVVGHEPRQPHFSEIAKLVLAVPSMAPSLPPSSPRPFRSGTPALDVFPYDLWSRLVTRHARHLSDSAFVYQDPAGYRPLREAIAAHVTVTRRVHCTPDQIIVVAGSQGGIDLAARMLVNAGDPVWMEDPGYLGARAALVGAGARIIPVPVDEEGLRVEDGIDRAPRARLAYLTPSHQFPLGSTMSLARRLAILEWAKRANAYLLEDDYDSEYRFSGRPLDSLQGLDGADRVIYIGTFSKVLFPALRVGYLILPAPLIEPFVAVRRLIDMHTPRLEQAVLTEFIVEGHFARHLRRMRILYAERRTALLEAMRALPLEVHSPEAGIHCVAWLPVGMDDLTLVKEAAKHEVDLSTVSRFSIEPLTRKGLILSYGGYGVQQIKDAVQRLAAAMRAI